MYVIGVDEWNFLNIKSKTMITLESCDIWNEVEKVVYDCNLNEATVFSDYGIVLKIVEEIKTRKDEILFENASIIGQILDKEREIEFNVDELKIYILAPIECDGR